jgi:hypothetical protein
MPHKDTLDDVVYSTPVCSYPIIVTNLSFNFLCLLLLYSIYLNGYTILQIMVRIGPYL